MGHPIAANGVARTALDVHAVPRLLDHTVFDQVVGGVPQVQASATFARLQLLATLNDIAAQSVSGRVVEVDAVQDIAELVVRNDVSLRLEQDAGILGLQI